MNVARSLSVDRISQPGAHGAPRAWPASYGCSVMPSVGARPHHHIATCEVRRLCGSATLRVAGIDDWAWKKGTTYGTMIVDLERRQVVDVLADRSADSTAEWLRGHPEVEIVSRDRAGLYADGARQGAPQARQIADRFHLLLNVREAVERQLGGLGAPD